MPRSLSPRIQCVISSLLYKREHYPLVTLESKWVPILHHPATNGLVRMVPAPYWPLPLVADWKEKSRPKVPAVKLSDMLIRIPLILFAFKILLVSIGVLCLAPSTWRYLQLSEPLPHYAAADLAKVPEGRVFRFTGSLDVAQAERKRKNTYYLPVVGTDRHVWIEQWTLSEDLLRHKLEKAVVSKKRAGWLDSNLTEMLAKNMDQPITAPVYLLDKESAPSIGMKITRVLFLIIPLVLIWLAGKWIIVLVRGR